MTKSCTTATIKPVKNNEIVATLTHQFCFPLDEKIIEPQARRRQRGDCSDDNDDDDDDDDDDADDDDDDDDDDDPDDEYDDEYDNDNDEYDNDNDDYDDEFHVWYQF
ncbi:hypothetical protein ElyMa_002559600 [Elysia marginata]|uniref:Uncharacterized protein n=1 Tax=Elysia marginata TaxID=1093978 RepID=A0AAV4GY77_9GAST|nr:hypothetical protein ElyMa_002559600 [Elysia marginata]